MEFWASSEIYQAADDSSEMVRHSVEPFLNGEFAKTSLVSFDCELRYIPIIMPSVMRERYPARSKIKKKEKVYLCAPQLDYDIFVNGTFEQQLREYLREVALSGPYLAQLGATPEQVSDFDKIMTTAVERILAERPDKTRH